LGAAGFRRGGPPSSDEGAQGLVVVLRAGLEEPDVLDACSPQAGGDGDPGAPAADDEDAVMDGRGHGHLPGGGRRTRGSPAVGATVAPRGVRTGGVPTLHTVRTFEGCRAGGKGIDAEEFVDAFPGEKVLAQEYGVSRQTMRQALRPLRESGVVTAQRGRSPRVRTDVIEQPIGALYSLFASVESAGMRQYSHTLALDERRDPDAAQHLGLEPTARLVHLARLRFAGEAPLALDRVWLPARIAAPLLEADFSYTALYREMAERIGLFPRRGTE